MWEVRRTAASPRLFVSLSLLLSLGTLPALAEPPGIRVLHELTRVRELVGAGDFERALDLAHSLAEQHPGSLFRNLPQQVLAEQVIARGDTAGALGLYRELHPTGGCLIAHMPSYWNSCERMAGLYARLGDRAGRIEMLRMLAHGAGLRDGTSRAHAYLDLAEAYDDIGEPRRAAAYYRSVLHTTDERRGRRRSQAALERHDFAEGEPDDVILHDALSSDPLLQRAGRAALARLSDPLRAFEQLLVAAVEAAGRGPAMDLLIILPLDDIDARLRDLLRRSAAPYQAIAQRALQLRHGLVYPYVSLDGEVHGGFDDASPFFGVWGTPYLVERMEDPYESERVRLMALDAIGRTGDPRGPEAILPHTQNLRPAWRVHAVHALRGFGGKRVEQALVARLDDPDPLVRLFAAAGVSRRQLPDAPDLLARALAREQEPLLAAALAEAIGAQGPAGASDALAGLARRLGGIAAAKAGEALCRLGDPRGIALLEASAGGEEPGASWAREALDRVAVLALDLSGTSSTALLDLLAPPVPVMTPPRMPGPDSSPEEIFAAALLGIAPPEQAIRELLESSRWSNYRNAAIALANSGVRTHLNAIRRRARQVSYAPDGSERPRYDEEMIEALGFLQDDASIPLLREVLAASGTRGGAQAAAARALGRLGDADAAPLLLAALTDPQSTDRVRRAAAAALARLDLPELGPLVVGGLESPNPEMRRQTLLLLRDIGGYGMDQVERLSTLDPEPAIRALASLTAGLSHGL